MAGAVLLLAALALTGGPSGAKESPPQVFDISVTAAPIVNDVALITVLPLPLDDGVARSSVSMNSQPLVISQAAVVYAPVAETVLATQPPELSAAAFCYSYFPSGPGNPAEARCGGGGTLPAGLPVEAGSGHTITVGNEDDPTTLRSESSTKATGIGGAGTPAPITAASAASAAQSMAVDDRMTAAGSTAVDDIDVGGVLAIRSVRSSVSGALSGTPGGAAAETDLVVEGASVGGQPVEIDETGVHAAGQPVSSIPGLDQQDQVNEALSAAGIRITVAPGPQPVISDDGTEMRASSGSLRIEFDNFAAGVLTRFDIGGVEVVMQASRFDVVEEGPDTPATDSAAPSDAAAGTAVGPTTPAPAATDNSAILPAPSAALGAPPPRAPKPGAGAGRPARAVTSIEVVPIGDIWDLPYPAYALVVLALPVLAAIRRFAIFRR